MADDFVINDTTEVGGPLVRMDELPSGALAQAVKFNLGDSNADDGFVSETNPVPARSPSSAGSGGRLPVNDIGALLPASATRQAVMLKNIGAQTADLFLTAVGVYGQGWPLLPGEGLVLGWTGPLGVICQAAESTTLAFMDLGN